VCVVFYSAYTFPNRKVKSGVGELREGSLPPPQQSTARFYTRLTETAKCHDNPEPHFIRDG